MIEVVPGRRQPQHRICLAPLKSALQRHRRALWAAALCLSLPACGLAQAAPAAAPAAGAPAAAPQIITVPAAQVPVPAASQQGPNWNNGNPGNNQANQPNGQNSRQNNQGNTQDNNGQDNGRSNTNSAQQQPAPDTPTEFQTMVAQTVGYPLPIFGSDLFNGAPSTFAPIGDAQVTQDYVIGPGDEIRISATGQLNQTGTFTVDRAGTITIPEVGTLTVAGLQFRQLQPFLRQQLGRFYRNFELSVTLGQLRSIQIYILGETRRPGAYTVSSLATLINALFASGGVRPSGSLRRIELRREGRLVTTLDLYDLLLRGDKSKDVPLQPGDVIFVPTIGSQVALIGSVTSPAIYELKGETTLAQLLTLASGLTNTANNATARIESIFNHAQRTIEEVSLSSASNVPLHDGDIVTVPPISDQYRNAVTLRGNVAAPGRYVWHPGMHISDLIPNRESLITRNYYRSLNNLGQPGSAYSAPAAHVGVATNPGGGSGGSATESATPTAATTTNSSGGGSSIADAMTQNSTGFGAETDVVLNAPDVDLSYAVVERLDTAHMTTSLTPFNLGAVLDRTDPSQNLELQPGDTVVIFSKADIRVPQAQRTRFVRLEGEFVAAGVYSVQPGETLRQLIQRAGGMTPDAYPYASEFTRQSVRRVEAQRLREFADSLDQQISTTSARDVSGSLNVAQAAQSEQVGVDAARAAVNRIRETQPTGRLVLKIAPDARGIDSIPDLALEDGDRFIVPRQPTNVTVAGQVYNAGTFLFEPSQEVRSFLRDAGGPNRNADHKRLFVIRANGSVISEQYSNVEKAKVLPGDTIVVPPQLTRRNIFRDAVTLSVALSQVALGVSILALLR